MTALILILEFLVIFLVYFFLNRRIRILAAQHCFEQKSLRDIYKRIKDKIVERD